MIEEIEKLMNDYITWLANKTAIKEVKDIVEITTPYLDRHNDNIQIYVRRSDKGYLLSDDGYTIADLTGSGYSLVSKKRKDILTQVLNGFGIQNKDGELFVNATTTNFALKKHNLIQAVLAVNDLFYLASSITTSLFFEDVTNWLDLNSVRYIQNIKFTGVSGYDHLFDFVIPKSKEKPDRYLRAINNPNRETAESYSWAWFDIRENRADSKAYAVLNDSERNIPTNVTNALLNYDITPILWSEREESVETLAL